MRIAFMALVVLGLISAAPPLVFAPIPTDVTGKQQRLLHYAMPSLRAWLDAEAASLLGPNGQLPDPQQAQDHARSDITRHLGNQIFAVRTLPAVQDTLQFLILTDVLQKSDQQRHIAAQTVPINGLAALYRASPVPTSSANLAEMSEIRSLRLQMMMDRRSKFMSTLSNIMKLIDQVQDTMIQSIR